MTKNNALKTLVIMQLKDKIDLSFLRSVKKTLIKVILSILIFALVSAVVFLLFKVSILLHLFSIINIVPTSIMVVILTIILSLSIITCTYGLMKTLYFSPDNPILLTLPVNSTITFVSKIIVYYFYELIKNLTFVLPILVGFGLISSYGIYYYLWVSFALVLVTAIPVAIGSLVSIPAMFIAQILKQQKYLQIALAVITCGVLVYLIFKSISLIPTNINLVARWGYIFNLIQDFLEDFSKTFIPFMWITEFIIGLRVGFYMKLFSLNTLFIFLGIVGVIAIFFAVAYFLSKPLFLKMASKPFEYKKSIVKKKKFNSKKSAFFSELKYDCIKNFRTPQSLYTTITIFFALPVAIFFFNKILSAMNTKLLGQYMVYSFNFLIILLIVLSSNYVLSSVYSRNGLIGPNSKTHPTNPLIHLLSRIVWNTIFSTISIIITVVLFKIGTPIDSLNCIMIGLTLIFINIGHELWSAELDMMHPLYQQYATFGASVNNPNERKSTIIAFLISFMVFGISLFLFNDNADIACLKILLLGIAFVVARIYMFITKANVYYKEIM